MYQRCYGVLIFSIFLEHISYSSDALILIKCGRIPSLYFKNEEGPLVYDPLSDFKLQSRIQLCDAVLNARQFVFENSNWYMEKRLYSYQSSRIINLTKWYRSPGVAISSVLNYQRLISSRLGGSDSPVLKYVRRSVRIGRDTYRTINTLQCVRTAFLNWFVTFSLIDKFMYLVEHREGRVDGRLRVAGILEPRPLLDTNREFDYLESQLQNYRDEMESICLLGDDDRLRLCSAIFVTLGSKPASLMSAISQFNSVKNERRCCVLRNVQIDDQIHQPYLLRCQIVDKDNHKLTLSLLYVLADTSERGAAFVFSEVNGARSKLKLHARVMKIGALVNPIGPREVRLNPEAKLIRGERRKGKRKIDDLQTDDKFVSWREREAIRAVKSNMKLARKRIIKRQTKSKKEQLPPRKRCAKYEDEYKTSEDEYLPSNEESDEKQKTRKKELRGKRERRRLEGTSDSIWNTMRKSSKQLDRSRTEKVSRYRGKRAESYGQTSTEIGDQGRPAVESSDEETKFTDGDNMMEEGSDWSKDGDYNPTSEEDTQESEEYKAGQMLSKLENKTASTIVVPEKASSSKRKKKVPTSTNVPPAWGRRVKRSSCTYDK